MSRKGYSKRLHLLLVIFALFLAAGPMLMHGHAASKDDLDAVWQRVQKSGAYRFQADILQINTPQATIINAGRTRSQRTLYLEGDTDIADESLHLMLWTEGGSVQIPDSAVEVRIYGARAMARQGSGAWKEIEDFTGLFAPGGDFFAYTQAAENVARHAPETRSTIAGDVEITRYTFEIDGQQLAIQMREQMREQAIREGLPATTRLELPKVYAEMTGTGELWVGADGMPLRQIFALRFPPDSHDYVTSADITVNFSSFAPIPALTLPYRIHESARNIWGTLTAPQAVATFLIAGLCLLFAAVVIFRRRSRRVYFVVALAVIFAMLPVPLLTNYRVAAFSRQQAEKQERSDKALAEAEMQAEQQKELLAPRMDPNRSPLSITQQQTTPDNIARYYDSRCESDPGGDIDQDSLTNLQECLLGTLIDVADSDGDGASDSFEVIGVNYNGTTWYTDPLNQDSNNDGISDGKEWFTDPDNDGTPDLDTDGDGRPDIWDRDNDNDGVMDKLDLSPYVSTVAKSPTPKTFTQNEPLELTLDQLMPDELVKVEFQIQPTNHTHLGYSQNVLDWPQGDVQGNIQDVDGKSFYDVDPSIPPSPNANGDVRMVPLLEIQFDNADANLPSADTCTDDEGNSYPCYPLLEQLGVSITIVDDDTSVAYVPLQLVTDSDGDAKVAFYGRMFYQASGSWKTPHHVRMVWAVQALNDICAEYENGYCTKYETYNKKELVHTYYDDWHITGLHVTEEHSADMALVYEDPTQTGSLTGGDDVPFYMDVLFGLTYGLDQTLMAGRCTPMNDDGTCAAGATRDFTVDDIYTRFNHATNSGVSDTDRWNLPNVFSVEKNEYEAVDLGMFDTTITQTMKILDDHFTAAWSATTPISPTILLAYEQTYRDLNLDAGIATGNTNLQWSGNALTLDLAQTGANVVTVDTSVSAKWTPYTYDPAGGWAAADIQKFWLTLDAEWGPTFVDPDHPDQADTYQTLAQYQYMTLYSGANSVVVNDDVVLPQPYQHRDETLADQLIIGSIKYTLLTMQKYYSYSAELAEIADAIRPLGDESYLALKSVGVLVIQKVTKLYDTLGKIGFIVAVTAVAIIAIVAATTYFLAKTNHSTGINWTLAISAGLVLTVLTVVTPVYTYVELVQKTIAQAAAAGEDIGYITAIGNTLTEMNTLTTGAEIIGALGLILTIGVAIGFFIAAWADGSTKAGSIAFNEGIALTIATIVVAIVLYVLSLFVVGGIIVAILSVIDIVLELSGSKFSITATVTKWLASVIYQYNLYTELEEDTGQLENTLVNPGLGLVAGNQFSYTLPITTTLTRADGILSLIPPDLRYNSIVYRLASTSESFSTARGARYNEWIIDNDTSATVKDYPMTSVDLVTGVNAKQPLQLNVAWALGGQSCWLYVSCSDKTVSGNSATPLDDGLIFDVLPQTIDEFVNTSENGWSGGALSSVDADGDGLLAAPYGGLDPDDTTWDADGDNLADSYELEIGGKSVTEGGLGLDASQLDSDGDLISDGDEIWYGTNPHNSDSDDDGLLDSEEIPYVNDVFGSLIIGGWELPYSPTATTRVWSDPLSADADADGLSDLFERTQITCPTCTPWADPSNPTVFNPNVWNVSPVALFVEDNTTNGFVAPGATVAYTSTTKNSLTGGQLLSGKLSVDAPPSFSATNTEANVNVTAGASESLVTTLRVDAATSMTASIASTMELADYEATVWSWDPPESLDETAGGGIQEAASVALVGWHEPILLVTREIAANNVQSIVAYLTSSSGELRGSQTLYTSDALTTLSAPAVACTDGATCLVTWSGHAGSLGFVWSTLLTGQLPTSPTITETWSEQADRISVPGVASDGSTFMIVWAKQVGSTQTFVAMPHSADATNPSITHAQIHTSSSGDLSDPSVHWDGTNYHALWAEDGSLQRVQLNATTGAGGPPVVLYPGRGIPAAQGLAAPPQIVFDPLSRQSLVLYQGADTYLYAGRLNTSNSFEPIALDASTSYDRVGTRTALCADPKNSGWVAAWSPPGTDTILYQGIGPDGTLRGEQQAITQTASTDIALACNVAKPVLELEFEEAEGATSFADSSGYGHDATCTSCPKAGVEGRTGNGIHFGDNAVHSNFEQPTSNFTVELWVKDQLALGGILNRMDQHQGLWLNNFKVCADVRQADGSFNEICTGEAPTTTWTHIVHVGNDDNHQIYINGVLQATSDPLTYLPCTSGNCTDFTIGNFHAKTGVVPGMNANVDDVRFYDRALSATEIASAFDSARAIYDLDGVEGSQIAIDSSGNSANMHCSDSACPTLGVEGIAYTAAQFDGQDDFFEYDGYLVDGSFTAAAWAKRAAPGSNDVILSQSVLILAKGVNVLNIGFSADDRFMCAFANSDDNPDVLSTAEAYLDTGWNHWVCTYDSGTKKRTIYRNGIQVAQDTTASYPGGGSLVTTRIGRPYADADYFGGTLDEIGIWKKALTAEKIAELYTKVKPEDQSVMLGTLSTANGTDTLTQNLLILRETTTDVGAIKQTFNRTLTVDADSPTVNIQNLPDNQYIGDIPSLVVAGTATDPTSYIDHVDVTAAGSNGSAATGTSAWTYAWSLGGLAEGEHTISANATDAVGNGSPTVSKSIRIDRTAPTVSLNGNNETIRSTRNEAGSWLLPLSGIVSDAGSGVAEVDVVVDGAGDLAGQGWQMATVVDDAWTLDYRLPSFGDNGQSLPEPTGSYTVTVRATDAVSNTNIITGNVTVDETGPDVVLSSLLSSTTVISTALVLQGTYGDISPVESVEVNFTPGEQIDALSGAVMQLPFDESQANHYFSDQSGAHNDVTCTGSQCPTVGQPGQRDGAFRFDGSTDRLNGGVDVVSLARDDFTIGTWVKTTGTSVGILTKSNNNSFPDIGERSFYLDDTGVPNFVGNGNGYIRGTTAVNDDQWHHVVVTWDYSGSGTAGTAKIYVDGVDDTASSTNYAANNADNAGDDFKIAVTNHGKEAPNFYVGLLDEFIVYPRALASYEVANLYANGKGTWELAQSSNGTWTYTIPQGQNGIEGLYQLNIRGSDVLGNVTPLGAQRVWRGEIDTKPPVLDFVFTDDGSGAIPTVTYECVATDFNLVQSQTCEPVEPATIPIYRANDMTVTTYDQVDEWYAATIPDTSRLYQIDAARTYSGTSDSSIRIHACDRYNHCATAMADTLTSAVSLGGGEILSPSSGTVLTSTEPITIQGDAYARNGLQAIAVKINGTVVHTVQWETADILSAAWQFTWIPPGEGVYTIEILVDDWTGDIPLAAGVQDQDISVDLLAYQETAPAPSGANPDSTLNNNNYFPLIHLNSQNESGPDGQSAIYLPAIVNSKVNIDGYYTGTVATLYVDSTPPQIELATTVLTLTHALGERAVELSGAVSDNVKVQRVDVRIDGGPWQRAGIGSDGMWRWPWVFAAPPDGKTFTVTARATDLAGYITEVIEQVIVDIATPQPIR